MRKHIEKWNLPGWPGRNTRRCIDNLKEVAKTVAPRVHTAVLSTVMDRWTTFRRFGRRTGQNHHCKWNCSHWAEDSLQHYMICPKIKEWAKNRLQITEHSDGSKMGWTMTREFGKEDRIKHAWLCFVAYTTFNHLKHNPNKGNEYITRYMSQTLHEAQRGQQTQTKNSTPKKARDKDATRPEREDCMADLRGGPPIPKRRRGNR